MPVRILYISDFDRVGDQMPVSAARKIEFLLWNDGLDLDIELRQIMLTEEQCQQYELPRTPLKKEDPGKARFEERFGEGGGTELDALVALHPGELERILEEEIARYYDYDLDGAIEETAEDIQSDLDDINDAVHSEFELQIEELTAEYEALDERRKSLYLGLEDLLRERAPYLGDIEWPEPADGDEHPDPLFDSRRDYVTQIDRYKQSPRGVMLDQC